MVIASRALEGVKSLWNRVPHGVSTRVHAALDWTGVPYFLNYLACYEDRHQLSNFAGNLVALHAAHARSSTEQRQQLAQQFEEITESLIMKNGVKKSTHPMRQQRILTQVLADPRCRLDKPAIKVLEIPSSIGMTALDNFATLSQRHGIRAYVMGDLFWQLHYDMDRECVSQARVRVTPPLGCSICPTTALEPGPARKHADRRNSDSTQAKSA